MLSTPRYGQYPDTVNPLSGRFTHYIQMLTMSTVQQIHSLIDPDTVSNSLQQRFTV